MWSDVVGCHAFLPDGIFSGVFCCVLDVNCRSRELVWILHKDDSSNSR